MEITRSLKLVTRVSPYIIGIIFKNTLGTILMKRARGAGLQGTTGTWGEGRGRQDSERRYMWWRPTGVEACPGGQVVQDRKSGENWAKRAEQLSLRVADGEGVRK